MALAIRRSRDESPATVNGTSTDVDSTANFGADLKRLELTERIRTGFPMTQNRATPRTRNALVGLAFIGVALWIGQLIVPASDPAPT